MAVEKIIALDNVDAVVNNEVVPVNVEMDLNTANAYVDSAAAAEHVEEVITELNDKAEDVITENPEELDVKVDNMYTKKITLDESVEDYRAPFADLSDESDEDEYLDYDMFDFVYGIVTDSWPKPKNPLDHPIRKFRPSSEDNYSEDEGNKGVPQVSTDRNGNVVVYANSPEDFDDARAVCEYYHIKCREVTPRASKSSHWGFNMTIEVPKVSGDIPMTAEDFFAEYDLTLADVIEDHKVGGGKSANWGKTYQNKVNKDRAELTVAENDAAVEKIYDKYSQRAAWSNDPLEGFIKDMFAEMSENSLKFSKPALKKRFLMDFEDDFEDDLD